jgi:hypothetical protein
MKEMETINNNAGIIKGLREMADFLEARPSLPSLPWVIGHAALYGKDCPAPGDIARALGSCKKLSEGDSYFSLEKTFTGYVSFTIKWVRETVCKKVITKETQEVYEYPEGYVAPEMVKVTKEVEVVKWECPESILAEASK